MAEMDLDDDVQRMLMELPDHEAGDGFGHRDLWFPIESTRSLWYNIVYRYIYIQHTYKRKIICIYILMHYLCLNSSFSKYQLIPWIVLCVSLPLIWQMDMARCVLPSRGHATLLSGLDRKPSTGGLGTIIVVLVCSYCVLSAALYGQLIWLFQWWWVFQTCSSSLTAL